MAALANTLLLLDGCWLLYFSYVLSWVAGIGPEDVLSEAQTAAIPRLRWLYRTVAVGSIVTLVVVLVHVTARSLAEAGREASVLALGYAAVVTGFLVWLTFSKVRRW